MWAEQQRDLQEAAIDALRERVSAEDIARFGDHAVTRVSANAADAIVDFARAVSEFRRLDTGVAEPTIAAGLQNTASRTLPAIRYDRSNAAEDRSEERRV